VAVVDASGTRYQGTFGLRDRERRLPVTAQTSFNVASLTKSFTVAALLEACAERGVDIDSPIADRGEVFVLRNSDVTQCLSIADVLSHRTGLPSHDFLWYTGGLDAADLRGRLQYLELVPGGFRECFIYNNVAYAALGDAFATLTGADWLTQVESRILQPLDLRTTSLELPSGGGADVAQPYIGTTLAQRRPINGIAAAGGLSSNLEDMARWLGVLLAGAARSGAGEVLSADTLRRMRTPHVGVEQPNPLLMSGLEWLGDGAAYGLGLFLGRCRGRAIAYHMAVIDGFTSVLAFSPDEQRGVVVLTNANCSPVPGLLVQRLLTMDSRGELPPAAAPAAAMAAAHSPEITRHHGLTAVTGSYMNEGYGEIEIVDADEGTTIRYGNERWRLDLRSEESAAVTFPVLGMTIELPAWLEYSRAAAHAIRLPLALDPRVAPERFVRR
jgi:CubicO group peptidase (beta-lactamase class C family)